MILVSRLAILMGRVGGILRQRTAAESETRFHVAMGNRQRLSNDE